MSSQVFSRPGLRALRTSWLLLACAVAASVFIVAGTRWFLDRERGENAASGTRLQEARARLDSARRERENLQESSEVFRTLVDRGLLQSERRLDLVEMVNALRARQQFFALDYEVSAQRPLKLPGGRVFPAVDVMASRVKLRMRALQKGDVLGFVDALAQSRQGFYPIDSCSLRRIVASSPDTLQPRIEAECSLEWITLQEKKRG